MRGAGKDKGLWEVWLEAPARDPGSASGGEGGALLCREGEAYRGWGSLQQLSPHPHSGHMAHVSLGWWLTGRVLCSCVWEVRVTTGPLSSRSCVPQKARRLRGEGSGGKPQAGPEESCLGAWEAQSPPALRWAGGPWPGAEAWGCGDQVGSRTRDGRIPHKKQPGGHEAAGGLGRRGR